MADPCVGCGQCCRHMVRPPFIVPDDPPPDMPADWLKDAEDWAYVRAAPPEALALIREDRLARPDVDEGPCCWLDAAGRCLYHEFRPSVCREFEPGEPACNHFRLQLGLIPLPAAAGDLNDPEGG